VSLTVVEGLFRRETVVVTAALILLILLAWLALLAGAGTGMSTIAMSGWWLPMSLPAGESWSWTPYYWLIALIMWAVMMVAMMLPSAAPMVLLYARVVRHADAKDCTRQAPASIAAFAGGYLTLWILFSVLAVVLQFGLERSGLMTMMMSSRSSVLSGGLLIAAGLYQLSPLKTACLRHCRGSAQFLSEHWRPGVAGAWRMGLDHGAFCVGCCAALMLLLFVGGIMNLVWIAGLTLFVAIEKLAPSGPAIAKCASIVLLLAGAGLIVSASLS
jgi:predicted metal-binding membrane protein